MIREFETEDKEQALDAWEKAAREAYTFFDESFFKKERKTLSDANFDVTEKWAYEADGKVVGFVAMIENEVGGIFVDPAYQGRGIGRALMDKVRETREFLELSVFEKNKIGRRFYDRYGFKHVGDVMNEEFGEMELRLRIDC